MLTTICIGLIKDNTLHSPLLFVLPKDGRRITEHMEKTLFRNSTLLFKLRYISMSY